MYFFVRYIDYDDFKRNEDIESLNTDDGNLPLGKNKELIVNPDCFVGVILDYIYKAAGIERELRSYFDLWTEKAKPVNVSCFEPNSSGLEVFNGKAIYYIVYRDIADPLEQIKPMLSKMTREYMDFFAYQRRRSSHSRRRSSGASKSTSKNSHLVKSITSKSSKGSVLLSGGSSKEKRSKSARSVV